MDTLLNDIEIHSFEFSTESVWQQFRFQFRLSKTYQERRTELHICLIWKFHNHGGEQHQLLICYQHPGVYEHPPIFQ